MIRKHVRFIHARFMQIGVFEPTEVLETWLAFTSIIWGLWFLGPWAISGTLSCPCVIIPETVWGVTFLVAGFVQLYLVLLGGEPAQWVDLVGVMLWVFVVGVVISADWRSTAVPAYTALALGNLWSFCRRAGLPSL